MTTQRPDQLEQLLKVKTARHRFTLGVPRSASQSMRLTMLTPEGASMLVSQGIDVRVENGTGDIIHYDNDRYARAGARIVDRAEALACDVVLYPGRLTEPEIEAMRPHAVLLTLAQSVPTAVERMRLLLGRRITVMALDRVRDQRGNCPLADILGEVSGRAAIVLAASFLADAANSKGILLGGVAGVNPCEVVILGTGMAALGAARSAIGLGSMVRLFDSDPYCLRRAIAELGPSVIGSALHPRVLGHALASADVVVATTLSRHFTIDGSVIDSMKKGVVIFDLDDRSGMSSVFPVLQCVDAAGAAAHGPAPSSDVCFIRAAGAVPRTAAMALTNDIIPIVDRMFGAGTGLQAALKTDSGLRTAAMLFRGRVVNQEIAARLGLKAVDINLMLTLS